MSVKEIAYLLDLFFLIETANAGEDCLQTANTPSEMNSCAGIDFEKAGQGLNKVLSEIERI